MKPNRLPPRLADGTYRRINEELVGTASEMIMYFAPQIEAEQFYRLCVPVEQADTLVNASRLMPPISRWSATRNVRLNTKGLGDDYPETVAFQVMQSPENNKNDNVDWLWPEKMNSITPESDLAPLLKDIIDLGIRWRIQMEIFKLVARDHVPNMIIELMPWLRTYVAGLGIRTKSSMDRFDVMIVRDIDKLISASTPRFVPGRSAWYNACCRDGEALMTQYIFMRAKKFTQPPKGWIYITPILGQELAPVELIEHHNEFVRAVRGVTE